MKKSTENRCIIGFTELFVKEKNSEFKFRQVSLNSNLQKRSILNGMAVF